MKNNILGLCVVVALVALGAALAFPYAWPGSYEQASVDGSKSISNAIPRVAVIGATYAAQAGIILPDGLDYGDRIWGLIDADSVVGAGGGMTFFESIPLDSLRWNATQDSLVCGVELSRTALIFYDNLTD